MSQVLGEIISPIFADQLDSSKVLSFDISGATTQTTQTINLNSLGSITYNFPDNSGALVTESAVQSLTSKNITDITNTVYANSIGSVNISLGAEPTADQALIAVDSTTATWQDVSSNNVMTTRGDVEYQNNLNIPDRLPIGTSNQFLRVQDGNVAWSNFINMQRESYFYDDFRSQTGAPDLKWNTNQAGSVTGNVLPVTGNYNGVYSVGSTGASARYSLLLGAATSLPLGFGVLTIETAVLFPVLSTVSDDWTARIGLGQITTSSSDQQYGVYFEYTSNLSNFQCKTANNNVRTTTDSGVVVTANTWYRLTIIINSSGTSADYYINGTYITTISSNFPPTRTCTFYIQYTKGVSTQATAINIDYFTYNYQLTNNRY